MGNQLFIRGGVMPQVGFVAGALIASAALVAILISDDALAQNRDVTIVLPDEPGELEPCQAKSNHVGRVIMDNVFETFAVRDIETGVLTPHLATSWKQQSDLTWRFELRKGVKFHDGGALNAASVKSSIDRTMNPDMGCQTRTKYFGDRKIKVDIVGDYTLDITTEQPDPIFPLIVSTHPIYSTKGMPAGEMTREPGAGGGTGPYTFASWQAGQQIVLERNADYWGAKPAVEKAIYVWRSESSVRAAMVKQGEADLAPIIAPQDVTPGFGTAYPNAETTRLNLDLLLEPMSDKRVRAAMNYGIDRDALKVTVGPDVIKATHLFVPQIDGFNPRIEIPAYNPKIARALIASAKADGVDVDKEIEFVGRIGHFPGDFELIQALASMYNDIGLNVRVQMYESAQKNRIQKKPYAEGRPPQIIVDQHDNTLGDPAGTISARWHSRAGQSKTNDSYIDAIIDYSSQASGAERTWAWQQTMVQVDALFPNVMLYHMVGYAAVGPRIDFQPTVFTNSAIHLSTITFK
jgi:peptide/nickel transport system substrate-binding protein